MLNEVKHLSVSNADLSRGSGASINMTIRDEQVLFKEWLAEQQLEFVEQLFELAGQPLGLVERVVELIGSGTE